MVVAPYWRLMRFHRPIGIWLLLWPTLWALWLASHGEPALSTCLVFICGVVLMRAAGCVANDLLDRNIDAKVSRTRDRPLAAAHVSVRAALLLLILLLVLSANLLWFLHPLTRMLALVAVALALLYPLAKRYFPLPQVVLGVAFAFGIPMVFAEVTGQVPAVAWILFFATMLWIVAYDTQYALSDLWDDQQLGVYSATIFFGNSVRWVIGALQGLMLLVLVYLGFVEQLGFIFYVSIMFAGGLFVYQACVLKPPEWLASQRVFAHNHWVGLAIFLGLFFS